jgi:hypothetical protein
VVEQPQEDLPSIEKIFRFAGLAFVTFGSSEFKRMKEVPTLL